MYGVDKGPAFHQLPLPSEVPGGHTWRCMLPPGRTFTRAKEPHGLPQELAAGGDRVGSAEA